MSYSACSNSAIFKPAEYLEGAIGSVFQPVLNETATASGAVIELWDAFVLPKGVWMITGAVQCDSASVIESVLYEIKLDIANVQRFSVANGAEVEMWISFQSVVVADGEKELTCEISAVTAGSAWSVTDAPNSVVNVTRIA